MTLGAPAELEVSADASFAPPQIVPPEGGDASGVSIHPVHGELQLKLKDTYSVLLTYGGAGVRGWRRT